MQSNKLYYSTGALYADMNETAHLYFYEDGTVKTIEPYRDGRLHGEATLYWFNGQLKRRTHFHFGVRQGLDQIWNEEGMLVDEGGYEKGKPVGVHRRWSSTALIEEVGYIDSVRFDFRQWDELGQLRFEGIWTGDQYSEKAWDRAEQIWIEKQGRWNGEKLFYV
jgi:antitoxin component YwqK of YwqJK toxin-antitoxin module